MAATTHWRLGCNLRSGARIEVAKHGILDTWQRSGYCVVFGGTGSLSQRIRLNVSLAYVIAQ